MEQINLQIPKISFKECKFLLMNNASHQERSNQFEEQNRRYIKAGYNENNTEYWQTFNVDNTCIEFGKTLFPKFSMSIIKQMPGQTIPSHLDTFFMFSVKNAVNPKDCVRVNIFLEDWKTGHYFEINENPILKWKKGDAVIVEIEEFHLSGNMGIEPKYTMQVTGVKNEFKRL